jgi:hypothetical protein
MHLLRVCVVAAGLSAGAAALGLAQPPKEVITPPAKGERLPDTLKLGDVAPDFTLKTVDGKTEVTLSEFRCQKPVVLIFGSYT